MRTWSVSVVLLLAVVACHREPSLRVFHGHGEVKGLGADQKSMRIAHDDIPGFMQAMTMEFAWPRSSACSRTTCDGVSARGEAEGADFRNNRGARIRMSCVPEELP